MLYLRDNSEIDLPDSFSLITLTLNSFVKYLLPELIALTSLSSFWPNYLSHSRGAVQGVDLAGIYIVDKLRNAAVLEAYCNLDEKYLDNASLLEPGQSITWDIILYPRVIKLRDMQLSDEIAEIAKTLKVRSAIGIPVRTERECIGVIWILSYNTSVFNEKLSSLLSSSGEIIATTIAGIKNREELKKKNSLLNVLSQLSVHFNEITNMDEILEILNHLLNQIHIVDAKAIYFVEDNYDKKIAKLEAHTGMPDRFLKLFSGIEHPKGITWECITNQQMVYYPGEKIKNYELSALAQKLGIKSMISIPIKLDQKTVGACNFISFRRTNFTHDELEFIKAFGFQIGTALARLKMEEKLRETAITDKLTGLYNSSYFHESLEKYIAAADRNNSKLSLIVIDLDEFKDINDKYGHLAGDKVIAEVGKGIKMNIRKMDIAARYGGDEFVIILPNTPIDLSKKIAKRLYDELIKLSVTLERNNIQPEFSMGLSTYRDGINSGNELIKQADRAMYINKRNKKSVFLHSEDVVQN